MFVAWAFVCVRMCLKGGTTIIKVHLIFYLPQGPSLGDQALADVVDHPVTLTQVVTEWVAQVVLRTDL